MGGRTNEMVGERVRDWPKKQRMSGLVDECAGG